MAIKKEIVCCICGEKIEGQAYKKGKKTYCSNCMEEEDVDWFDWCNLYEYIKKLNNTKDVSLRIITQLKRYKKENKLTDYGMLNTLRYIYEIDKQIALNTELDSVGLIPYYYDEASKYFKNKDKISEQAEHVNENENNVTITTDNSNFKIENNRKELQIGGEWEDEER